MKHFTRKENITALLGYIAFSIIALIVGMIIGVFDNDVREDGYTEIIHHKPSGDSRY